MRKMTTIQTVFLALCLGYLVSFAQEAKAGQLADTNRYVNCDYGYAVTIPSGLVVEIPEYQNHGFLLHFPDQESMIYVYNKYNSIESKKPKAVFDYELDFLKDDSTKTDLRIFNKRRKLVQKMHTIEVTASYKQDGKAWKSEIFIMYRPDQGDRLGKIVYVVRLSAPTAHFDNAMPYFNGTVEGLQLQHEPCPDE